MCMLGKNTQEYSKNTPRIQKNTKRMQCILCVLFCIIVCICFVLFRILLYSCVVVLCVWDRVRPIRAWVYQSDRRHRVNNLKSGSSPLHIIHSFVPMNGIRSHFGSSHFGSSPVTLSGSSSVTHAEGILLGSCRLVTAVPFAGLVWVRLGAWRDRPHLRPCEP